MCLPTAASITTSSFLPGRWRNQAFACQGMAQPLGYALGLILGGVSTDTIGWRLGFYISAALNVALFLCAFFALPVPEHAKGKALLHRLWHEVDLIGGLTLGTSLGLLSYVFS